MARITPDIPDPTPFGITTEITARPTTVGQRPFGVVGADRRIPMPEAFQIGGALQQFSATLAQFGKAMESTWVQQEQDEVDEFLKQIEEEEKTLFDIERAGGLPKGWNPRTIRYYNVRQADKYSREFMSQVNTDAELQAALADPGMGREEAKAKLRQAKDKFFTDNIPPGLSADIDFSRVWSANTEDFVDKTIQNGLKKAGEARVQSNIQDATGDMRLMFRAVGQMMVLERLEELDLNTEFSDEEGVIPDEDAAAAELLNGYLDDLVKHNNLNPGELSDIFAQAFAGEAKLAFESQDLPELQRLQEFLEEQEFRGISSKVIERMQADIDAQVEETESALADHYSVDNIVNRGVKDGRLWMFSKIQAWSKQEGFSVEDLAKEIDAYLNKEGINEPIVRDNIFYSLRELGENILRSDEAETDRVEKEAQNDEFERIDDLLNPDHLGRYGFVPAHILDDIDNNTILSNTQKNTLRSKAAQVSQIASTVANEVRWANGSDGPVTSLTNTILGPLDRAIEVADEGSELLFNLKADRERIARELQTKYSEEIRKRISGWLENNQRFTEGEDGEFVDNFLNYRSQLMVEMQEMYKEEIAKDLESTSRAVSQVRSEYGSDVFGAGEGFAVTFKQPDKVEVEGENLLFKALTQVQKSSVDAEGRPVPIQVGTVAEALKESFEDPEDGDFLFKLADPDRKGPLNIPPSAIDIPNVQEKDFVSLSVSVENGQVVFEGTKKKRKFNKQTEEYEDQTEKYVATPEESEYFIGLAFNMKRLTGFTPEEFLTESIVIGGNSVKMAPEQFNRAFNNPAAVVLGEKDIKGFSTAIKVDRARETGDDESSVSKIAAAVVYRKYAERFPDVYGSMSLEEFITRQHAMLIARELENEN